MYFNLKSFANWRSQGGSRRHGPAQGSTVHRASRSGTTCESSVSVRLHHFRNLVPHVSTGSWACSCAVSSMAWAHTSSREVRRTIHQAHGLATMPPLHPQATSKEVFDGDTFRRDADDHTKCGQQGISRSMRIGPAGKCLRCVAFAHLGVQRLVC